ncbi:MAG: bifunctional DNA primase/polymerase, partial [Candidatus Bathyarchaeia archaeon]
MDLKAAAKQYWTQGLPVVVLKEKKPLHEWQKWQSQKQTEEEFENLPWRQADGFAVVCGTQLQNSLYVGAVDFDVKNLPQETIDKGKQVLKFMPITQIEETPSKGQHWNYLTRKKPKSVSAFHNVAALELVGENKLLIMAPSQGYRRLNDNNPTAVEDLEALFYSALEKAGVKTKTEKTEAMKQEAWFDREDLIGTPFKGVAPPCISKLLAGTETGNRNEFAIRIASYLVNFRKVDVKKAWKEVKEWNEWNT